MKKVLLSLLLIGSVSLVFAQTQPKTLPVNPCPIDIKSNQGGGNCKSCESDTPGEKPNASGAGVDFTKGTGTVILDFGPQSFTCIPRLDSVQDKDGFTRQVFCGLGKQTPSNNGNLEISYCLFGDNDFNFFNQPDLVVFLSYECNGTIIQVACNSKGEQIILPVKLRSFTVARKKANVAAKWVTSTETNNKGFNVQRNTRGVWETVAFVPSQAVGGNSDADLTYSYTDINGFSGVSQYRIQQVDIDGRTSFSDIRSVRGEAQSGRTVVYPNPSNEGSVNVVFDDAGGRRDVIVSDISGRVVKSWRGIVENTLRITNLVPGTYMLRIVAENSGEVSHEKIVVNK